jgi:hypothetical protein
MDMRIQFEVLSFSILHIIICSLIPITIEIVKPVRYPSQRENYYYYGSSDSNTVYLRMKLVIYM